MKADFSGWATKSGVLCSDGRTIAPDAFAHQDKMKVPLVWSHDHNGPDKVLGHAILENRKEGVYAYAYLNETEMGTTTKELIKHGDVDSLSIFARRLRQQGSLVVHGDITELSVCINGANREAKIDNISIAHADGSYNIKETEAEIYFGEELEHEDPEGEIVGKQNTITTDEETNTDEGLQHSGNVLTEDELVSEFTAFTPKQKDVVFQMIGEALAEEGNSTAAHADTNDEEFIAHVDNLITTQITEGFSDMRNAFEQNGNTVAHAADRPRLSLDQLRTILKDGDKYGSLKESFLAHADDYGVQDINLLFPDARLDQNGITYVSRRMEWVQNVLTGVRKSPFSRVKSISADLTADEARAKGYVKGSMKKDEVIKLLRRITTPTTVYKKQKLDRDDIVDITEVDILVWIQAEMRVMLDEEIARAILIGDGRESDDDDKIDEEKVRPIAYDVDMYNTTVTIASGLLAGDIIDSIVTGLNNYKGSGTPTFYTTRAVYTKLLLTKDTLGRRLYATKAELAAALTVEDIVTVEVMESASDLFGIAVNLSDYQVGADKGGEINLFDFFDIDYNQQKYLLETRISGALTKPKSAVTFKLDAANVVTPQLPTFVNSTGVVTIPNQTGVVYTNNETGETLVAGAQPAIQVGDTIEIKAVPAANYGFTHDSETEFEFTRTV
jgi:hypothetical protein